MEQQRVTSHHNVGTVLAAGLLAAVGLACGGSLTSAPPTEEPQPDAPQQAEPAPPPEGYDVVVDLPGAEAPGLRIVQGELDVGVVDGEGQLVASGLARIDYTAIPVLAYRSGEPGQLLVTRQGTLLPCAEGMEIPTFSRDDERLWAVETALAERDHRGSPISHWVLLGPECQVIKRYGEWVTGATSFSGGWSAVTVNQRGPTNWWTRPDGELVEFPEGETPDRPPANYRLKRAYPRTR